MSRKKILLHISLLALIVWVVQMVMGGPCFSGIYFGNLLPDDSSLPECAQWVRETNGSPSVSVVDDGGVMALRIIDGPPSDSCLFKRETEFLSGPYSGNTAKLTVRLRIQPGSISLINNTSGIFLEVDDGVSQMYMCLVSKDYPNNAYAAISDGTGALDEWKTYENNIYSVNWNDGNYHTFELIRESDGSATLIVDGDTAFNMPATSLPGSTTNGGNPFFRFGSAEAGQSTTYWDSVQWSISEASPVAIDIKPGGCPNPLNVKSKGVLSVAILGREDFDVFWVDVATVTLQGVTPIHANGHYEDVSAPVAGSVEECECTEAGPDGFPDLVLHFDTQEIVAAMGEVSDGDEVLLQLDGMLIAGIGAVSGSDCVVIRKKGI